MKSLEAKGRSAGEGFLTFDDVPNYLDKSTKVEPAVLTAQKEIPRENVLKAIALKESQGTQPQLGEEIVLPDGTKARFIREQNLENRILYADPQLFVRQPRQPRSYFDPGKMRELGATIATHGQCDPVHVVPVLLPNKSIRLMLIDGERRFRIILNLDDIKHVKFLIEWVDNEDDLRERSFMLNAKEPHTVFETSDFYRDMVNSRMKRKGMNKGEAVADIAKSIGKSTTHVNQYLRFQVIEPAARVIFGNKVNASSVQSLVDEIGKTDPKNVNQAELAKKIMEHPFASRGASAGSVTAAVVRKVVREQLYKRGVISRKDRLERQARDGLSLLSSALYQGLQAVDFLGNHPELVEPMRQQLLLRAIGKPADVLHEDVRDLVDGFRAWVNQVINPAMKFPALDIPDEAPRFTDRLHAREKQLGGNVLRTKIARLLAWVSDSEDQRPLTAQEIAQILNEKGVQTDSLTVASNLLQMDEPLLQMGFELDIHTVVRRSQEGKTTNRGRGERASMNAYRLRWSEGALAGFKLDVRLKRKAD